MAASILNFAGRTCASLSGASSKYYVQKTASASRRINNFVPFGYNGGRHAETGLM